MTLEAFPDATEIEGIAMVKHWDFERSRDYCETYFPSFLWPFFEWYLIPFTFLYRFLQPGTGHAKGFSLDEFSPFPLDEEWRL